VTCDSNLIEVGVVVSHHDCYPMFKPYETGESKTAGKLLAQALMALQSR
jgi:hypothetical protein